MKPQRHKGHRENADKKTVRWLASAFHSLFLSVTFVSLWLDFAVPGFCEPLQQLRNKSYSRLDAKPQQRSDTTRRFNQSDIFGFCGRAFGRRAANRQRFLQRQSARRKRCRVAAYRRRFRVLHIGDAAPIVDLRRSFFAAHFSGDFMYRFNRAVFVFVAQRNLAQCAAAKQSRLLVLSKRNRSRRALRFRHDIEYSMDISLLGKGAFAAFAGVFFRAGSVDNCSSTIYRRRCFGRATRFRPSVAEPTKPLRDHIPRRLQPKHDLLQTRTHRERATVVRLRLSAAEFVDGFARTFIGRYSLCDARFLDTGRRVHRTVETQQTQRSHRGFAAFYAAHFLRGRRWLDGSDIVRDARTDGFFNRPTTRQTDFICTGSTTGIEAIHLFPATAFAFINAIEDRVLEVAATRAVRCRSCQFTDDFVESRCVFSQRDSLELHAAVSIGCA